MMHERYLSNSNEQELTIRIKSNTDIYYAYDFVFLLYDIYQIANYGNLLEYDLQKKHEDKEYLKIPNISYQFSGSRFNEIVKYSKDRITISKVNQGSIEIVFAGLSLISTIIVPFVIYNMQNNYNQNNKRLYFEFDCDDDKVKDLLYRFKRGDFGKPNDQYDFLFSILAKHGYDVSMKNENCILIQKELTKISSRMIKTING